MNKEQLINHARTITETAIERMDTGLWDKLQLYLICKAKLHELIRVCSIIDKAGYKEVIEEVYRLMCILEDTYQMSAEV